MKHFFTFLLATACLSATAKSYELQSPGKVLSVVVDVDEQISWSVSAGTTAVLLPSPIALDGADVASGKTFRFGQNAVVRSVTYSQKDERIASPFYKRAMVDDVYNEITIKCTDFSLTFRAYDDAAVYRFGIERKRSSVVNDEVVEFRFGADYQAFVPYVNDNRGGERYCYSFESFYDEVPLSGIFPDSLFITPACVCLPGEMKATIIEADLHDYPGMFLKKSTTPSALRAEFAPVVTDEVVGGHQRLNLIPTARAKEIARIDGPRLLPWRGVVVSQNDAQLLSTDIAYLLSTPCALDDISWIRPGQVAWDWWNALNIFGVDFEAGVNTATYQYYIDFASNNGIPYIIVDEGWSDEENLLQYAENTALDLDALVAYGQQKGVSVILWSSWRNAIKDTEKVFAHYAKMGIAGFKIDFFDRDDQAATRSMEELAQVAAKHHLLVDYHGAKPFGLHRTYPNIVNYEGVKGLENCKWEPSVDGVPYHDFPRYDVTAPFLRMLVGPMDYTPGAMDNASKWNFRAINDNPMSIGTRAHQVAMYVVYDAPLQMLADSPKKYEREPDCTDFITSIPTVWDETVVVDAKIGQYIIIARRSGTTWYLGALNNWQPRDFRLQLNFLPGPETFQATSLVDGVNANRSACDYVKARYDSVRATNHLPLNLKSGGGAVVIFQQK